MTFTRLSFKTLFLTLFVLSFFVFFQEAFRDDNFHRVDSPLYATISQNIAETGDWLHLKLFNNEPFEGDHPPLVFWASAFFINLFGNHVISAIFFCLLCGIATTLVTFLIGSLLVNPFVGFYSGIFLLLTRYVPRFSKQLTLEVPLMLWVTSAIYFFLLSQKKHPAFYLGWGFTCGLAVLTKGIVGFFPLAIGILYLIMTRKWKELCKPFFLSSLVVFLLIPLSWLLLKSQMDLSQSFEILKQYWQFVFGSFSGMRNAEMGSRLTFVLRLFQTCYLLIPGFLIFIYFYFKKWDKQQKNDFLLLWVWFFTFLIPFTISSWRIGYYLLPAYPAFALFSGIGINQILENKYQNTSILLVTCFFGGILLSPVLLPHKEPKNLDEVIFAETYFPKAKEKYAQITKSLPKESNVFTYTQNLSKDLVLFYHLNPIFPLKPEKDPVKIWHTSKKNTCLVIVTKQHYNYFTKKTFQSFRPIYSFLDYVFLINDPNFETYYGE